MARPREFDIDEAIERAMEVFWQHGYEGTSLSDLLAEIGITRGSLYKAFHDKRSLYLLAFERYERDVLEPATMMLQDTDIADGWIRVRRLFDQVIAAAYAGNRNGCLVCSAAAGPAVSDSEIAKRVDEVLEKMRHAFEIAITQSQSHEGLSAAERTALADALTAQYIGLRVLVRSQAPLATLERSVAFVRHLPGAPA